ncbi:hypothetical protein SETIT_6G120900v2 [Setaria italica]|uniref:F-box domain-containing protein n=1 Tax=Setaria italica TaxID=4555 RepID=K3YKZ0_SETIT|nr:hypothetical protein SETIT_6G120900v2 [Setaria italica]
MNNLVTQEIRTDNACGEAICEIGRPNVRLEDLPLDVLYKIVSKLPPKEFARTSVLSSSWRCMWSECPRLTFDAVVMCKCKRVDLHQHTERFIHEVNAVLHKYHGRVVETLEIRIDYVDSLVHHLNNWIDFAVSSRTKNITLDLKPKRFWEFNDPYVFPFKLFENGIISCLQHIQLSFVSLKPPSQFSGFPNLRKLHIQVLYASKKDLEHVLSHCCKLEWLHIDRCDLNAELTVDTPLSHLLYLYVEHCKLTKIKFHAVNLAAFKYEGDFIPVDLSHSSKLQNAYIKLSEAVLQHALLSLLKGLPYVQNLTLRIFWQHLEKQWFLDNPLKFSCLRHLQLFMSIYSEHVDKVLYSVSFLRATPFIENLEVHFTGYSLWLADVGPHRQDFGQCKYNYLKSMCITGFKGARGQVEFLLHVVENAPALEVLSVDTNERARNEFWPHRGSPPFEKAKQIAITLSESKTPAKC